MEKTLEEKVLMDIEEALQIFIGEPFVGLQIKRDKFYYHFLNFLKYYNKKEKKYDFYGDDGTYIRVEKEIARILGFKSFDFLCFSEKNPSNKIKHQKWRDFCLEIENNLSEDTRKKLEEIFNKKRAERMIIEALKKENKSLEEISGNYRIEWKSKRNDERVKEIQDEAIKRYISLKEEGVPKREREYDKLALNPKYERLDYGVIKWEESAVKHKLGKTKDSISKIARDLRIHEERAKKIHDYLAKNEKIDSSIVRYNDSILKWQLDKIDELRNKEEKSVNEVSKETGIKISKINELERAKREKYSFNDCINLICEYYTKKMGPKVTIFIKNYNPETKDFFKKRSGPLARFYRRITQDVNTENRKKISIGNLILNAYKQDQYFNKEVYEKAEKIFEQAGFFKTNIRSHSNINISEILKEAIKEFLE